MITRIQLVLGGLMVLASSGLGMAADAPTVGADDAERGVSVITAYRPEDGSVLIGSEIYRLSPEAAGSLAEQLRNRPERNHPFGAAVVFGRDPLGRPRVSAIRVVP